MSFAWTDYLTLAEHLCDNPDDPGPEEACLRSAISRSYYAAFKTVLRYAVLEVSYHERAGGGDHVALYKHMQSCDEPIHRKIGTDLNRLRINRKDADYKSELKQNPKSLAEASVLTAQEILEDLDALSVTH